MDAIRKIIITVENLKKEQKYTQAKQIVERSIITYWFDYRLYEELADIYLYKWELAKALKAINFSLEIQPDSATGNYLKWFILLSQDQVPESIKYLEKSNKFVGNNSEVLRNLWWAYTMIWKTERGIMFLKRALILSPDDELITEDLAMALIGIWEVYEGKELLKKIGKKNIS